MSTPQQNIAKSRLRRDLMDLKREKLLSIAAHPMDDNIFEWHANIKPNDGLYSGVYLHLILRFPDSYPAKPPRVDIMTPIPHPNAMGRTICLSMLRERTATVPYEGWSGAYSVTSVLMQLQSFLFADKIDQDFGPQANAQLDAIAVNRAITMCKLFHCASCGHNHHRPFPPVEGSSSQILVEPKDTDQRDQDDQKVDWHSEYIIDELWIDIFEYLSVQNVFKMQFVCRKWRVLIHRYNSMERGDMCCYYTKIYLRHKQLSDKDTILGIGLNIEAFGSRVELNSQMDILSYSAWHSGCRVGVWGEPLTHFLPLPMNKAHAEFAYDEMIKAMKSISSMYKSIQMKSFHGKQHMENPNPLERRIQKSEYLQIVDTLVTMMNQLVSQFVTANDETDPKKVSMVLCEKVVLGYCALHHLLLYLRSKHKRIITNFANKTIEQFLSLSGSRKRMTRDLGKLLIYLMISKYEWDDIAVPFVKESFTRRVRWLVEKDENKIYDTTKYVGGRIQQFITSKTGRRLVMFQVWFMTNNASETLKGYNQRLGRPKQSVRNGIVQKTKHILGSKHYRDYFKELKLRIKNGGAMDQLLRFAVWNSYDRGYHRSKDVHPSLYYLLYERMDPPEIMLRGKVNEDNHRNNTSATKKMNRTKTANSAQMKTKTSVRCKPSANKEGKAVHGGVAQKGTQEVGFRKKLSKSQKRKLRQRKKQSGSRK